MKKHYLLIIKLLLLFSYCNAQTIKTYQFKNYTLENNVLFFNGSDETNTIKIWTVGINQIFVDYQSMIQKSTIIPSISYTNQISNKWYLKLSAKAYFFNENEGFKYRQFEGKSSFYHAGKIKSIDLIKKISFSGLSNAKIVNGTKTSNYFQFNTNLGLTISKKININSLPLRFNLSGDIFIYRPFDIDLYENYSTLLIDGTSIKADISMLFTNKILFNIYIKNQNEFISNTYLGNSKLQLITPTYGAELSYFFNYSPSKSPSFIF